MHCSIMTFDSQRSWIDDAEPTGGGTRDHVRLPAEARAAAEIGGTVIAEAQAVSSLAVRLFEARWRTAAAGFSTLLQCRTAQDVLAAQAAFICEDLDLLRGGCERLSEIIAEAAGDTVRSLPAERGARRSQARAPLA